jgi:hypothetical protein
MNSREKAQKTQKKAATGNWLDAGQSALEGSRFVSRHLYRLAASGSRERSLRPPFASGGALSSQRGKVHFCRDFFALFAPFCGYSIPTFSYD